MAMLSGVELRELRIFLVLADELHFGRTAERLGISQPSVSEAVRLLERRVNARLFERTSRRVSLTPVGAELQLRLAPVIESLDRVLEDTHDCGNEVSGVLRVGTTYTTLLPPVRRLGKTFRDRYPNCALDFSSVSIKDPFSPLRRGKLDVVVNWLPVGEPDLTDGPALAYYDRVLAVSPGHRLAARESISLEELADEVVNRPPATFPTSFADAIYPLRTPSGRIIRRVALGPDNSDDEWSYGALIAAVARGELVHPTMRGVAALELENLVLVPIRDLPCAPLGLIWRNAAEDARIRALAEVARSEGPWPATGG
jgi:DNA-binding transcriptional LysR family regulator